VDGTGSGSCPMAGFGISGVEPSGCMTRKSLYNLHRRHHQTVRLLGRFVIHSGLSCLPLVSSRVLFGFLFQLYCTSYKGDGKLKILI
jgi:hypothetical protein